MRRLDHRAKVFLWLIFAFLLVMVLSVALVSWKTPEATLSGVAALEPTAVVSVDTAKRIRALNNPSRYQNQADHSQQLTEWQVGQMRSVRPKVTRAWVTPMRFFDEMTGRFDFDYPAPNGSSAYQYLDQVMSYSERLFLNFNQCDQSLMDPAEPQACAEVLYQGIKHYKQRYPALEFVEVFNEPDRDWKEPPGSPRSMGARTYYLWYRQAYRAVNRVNAELRPQVPLKVGGPVTYHFNASYIRAFLDEFRDDRDPRKRLDFISYHQYKARANPAVVAQEKKIVGGWLAERGINPETPVYVTEYGVFPGDNTGTSYEDDLLTHAAAMSVLGAYYAKSGMDMPMHWVIDHPTNTRKSMFVDEKDEVVYPYFNIVRMQRMLRDEVIHSSSSDLTEQGTGIVALATADSSGASVLVTNYQWINPGPDHLVAIDVAGLKARKVAVTVYLVDSRHNNLTGGGLKAVTSYVAPVTGSTRVVVDLEYNATALLTIEAA